MTVINNRKSAQIASPDDIRAAFAMSLSEMYRKEVPQYGTLLNLVADINQRATNQEKPFYDSQHRVEVERHGAIRVGTASELTRSVGCSRSWACIPLVITI